MRASALLALGVIGSACGSTGSEGGDDDGPPGGADPSPVIGFTQVGRMVGIDRANEPASAGPFNPDATLAYGPDRFPIDAWHTTPRLMGFELDMHGVCELETMENLPCPDSAFTLELVRQNEEPIRVDPGVGPGSGRGRLTIVLPRR